MFVATYDDYHCIITFQTQYRRSGNFFLHLKKGLFKSKQHKLIFYIGDGADVQVLSMRTHCISATLTQETCPN